MERKEINPTSPYESTQYGFPYAIKPMVQLRFIMIEIEVTAEIAR